MKLTRATTLALALAIPSAVLSIVVFNKLPEQVAVHWNIEGVADVYAPRAVGAFMLPLLIVLLPVLSMIANRCNPRHDNLQRSQSALHAALVVVAVVLAMLHVGLIAFALQMPVDVPRLVMIGIGLILVVAGNYLGKTRSNFVIGIRTRWTLSSERVWDRVHRVGGRWLVAEGLLLMLLALVGSSNLPLMLIGIALPVLTALALVAYSYHVFQRESRPAA